MKLPWGAANLHSLLPFLLNFGTTLSSWWAKINQDSHVGYPNRDNLRGMYPTPEETRGSFLARVYRTPFAIVCYDLRYLMAHS